MVQEIAPEELKRRLDGREPVVLLDVREDWEVQLCALDNAVHIPLPEVEFRAGELRPEDEVIVYCHQGVRSAAVADYLWGLGFRKVWNLAGGLDSWARRIDPAMRRY
jgi:rhodanese-related sulfurtransferase